MDKDNKENSKHISVNIRQATKKDLHKIEKVNLQCLPENYPLRFYKSFFYKFPGLIWVAEIDGRIEGYVMAQLIGQVLKRGHIWSIAVNKSHRKKGVGSALLKVVEKQLIDVHDVRFVTLHTRKNNNAAVSVYNKLGYVIKRTISGYYPDGAVALYMAKYMKSEAK